MKKTNLNKLGNSLASLHNAISKIEGRYARAKSGDETKKKFLIAVEWSDCAEIEVEANSLEEALKIADEEGVGMTTQNKEYIDGSLKVNEEFSKYLNSEEYKLSK